MNAFINHLIALYCLFVLVKGQEYCARFSDHSDGDISYDPDDELGLRLGSIATLQCHNGNIRRSRCSTHGWKPPQFNRCSNVVRDDPHSVNQLVANGQLSSFGGCLPINNISNGFVTYSALGLGPFKADTVATLNCHLGYLQSGRANAKCDPSGVWTELGSCESATVQQCLPIAEVPNGQIAYTNGPNGAFGLHSVAELSCKLGYSGVGNNRVTCEKTGWSPYPGLGFCVEKKKNNRVKRQQLGIGGAGQCPPQSVLNGQITYLQSNPTVPYSSGSTAILTCQASFQPIGSTSSYCSGTIWTPALGTCQQFGNGAGGVPTLGGSAISGIPGATCQALPAPLNGQITYSMGGTIGPFGTGTTATVLCSPGFSVTTGMPTATCQNGIWNPSQIGSCTSTALNNNGLGNTFGGFGLGTTCPALITPANGQLQYSTGSGIAATYPEGSTVTVVCNAGFSINGPATSSCRAGQWSPPTTMTSCLGQGQGLLGGLGTLNPVGTGSCPVGLLVVDGRVTYSNGLQVGPFNSGTVASVQCNNGGPPMGATSSTCQNGNWSPISLGACSPSTGVGFLGSTTNGQCTVGMLTPANGQVTYSQNGQFGPWSSGTSATLTCNPGFIASGSPSAYCQSGMWSPASLGVCMPSSG